RPVILPEQLCILRYPRLTVGLVRMMPLRALSTWPILMLQSVITGLVTWRNLTLSGRIRMLLPAMGERGGFFYSRGLVLPRCWSSSWQPTSRRRLVGVEVAAPVDLVLRSTCTSTRLGPRQHGRPRRRSTRTRRGRLPGLLFPVLSTLVPVAS